jgi:hypothetical protein
MARLPHDHALLDAVGGGGQAGTQRVAGERRGVEPGRGGAALDDQRHRLLGQRGTDPAVAIHGAEHPAIADAGRRQTRLQRGHRAYCGAGANHTDHLAGGLPWSVLLRLMVTRRPSATTAMLSTLSSSLRRSAAAKPSSSRARSRRPSSDVSQDATMACTMPVVAGAALALRGAEDAADPAQAVADRRVLGIEPVSRQSVHGRNGGEPPPQRCDGQVLGQRRQIRSHCGVTP